MPNIGQLSHKCDSSFQLLLPQATAIRSCHFSHLQWIWTSIESCLEQFRRAPMFVTWEIIANFTKSIFQPTPTKKEKKNQLEFHGMPKMWCLQGAHSNFIYLQAWWCFPDQKISLTPNDKNHLTIQYSCIILFVLFFSRQCVCFFYTNVEAGFLLIWSVVV